MVWKSPLKSLSQLVTHNRFASLPPVFYTRLSAKALPEPYLVHANAEAAALIELDATEFSTPQFLDIFSGNVPLPGGETLASVYSGHQFGVWAGQLGDGRAHLLGEVIGAEGLGWELQLKGSGQTPYSRMGDGRAVLRSSIREYLCSEAMHALGIPTTRALCIVGADLPVFRETTETAAVVTRMSPSFIRFGHFEHFCYTDQHDALRTLADFVIDHYYPAVRDAAQPYLALLREVMQRTARLIAQWQGVGFMHGVMNTDNMSILGLTLDYGPYGFMDAFDGAHICNHSDTHGRYAYYRQPEIAHWNLYALAQALLPLIEDTEAVKAVLNEFPAHFSEAQDEIWRAKLGLRSAQDGDTALMEETLQLLHANHADFTLFFRHLGQLKLADPSVDAPVRDLFIDRAAFDAWAEKYHARLRQEDSCDAARQAAMSAVNPKYVLRNHLVQAAIERAQQKDFSEIDNLLKVLRTPYDEQPESERYAAPPPEGSHIEVSCSS
ncbi:MAG: YdiU family protein [Burkholderiaceae bacterium]|nr:MAG: YdiU family protein [Burkholderiaceae bacterium]